MSEFDSQYTNKRLRRNGTPLAEGYAYVNNWRVLCQAGATPIAVGPPETYKKVDRALYVTPCTHWLLKAAFGHGSGKVRIEQQVIAAVISQFRCAFQKAVIEFVAAQTAACSGVLLDIPDDDEDVGDTDTNAVSTARIRTQEWCTVTMGGEQLRVVCKPVFPGLWIEMDSEAVPVLLALCRKTRKEIEARCAAEAATFCPSSLLTYGDDGRVVWDAVAGKYQVKAWTGKGTTKIHVFSKGLHVPRLEHDGGRQFPVEFAKHALRKARELWNDKDQSSAERFVLE